MQKDRRAAEPRDLLRGDLAPPEPTTFAASERHLDGRSGVPLADLLWSERGDAIDIPEHESAEDDV